MDAGFEFVQTRIQARLPRLPDESLWLRLAAQKGLPAYLESARPTPIGPWLSSLSSASDAHEVERIVRGHLAAIVEEVAHWVPEPWAPAVRWSRWLAYLPDIETLIRGQAGTASTAEAAALPLPVPGPEQTFAARALQAGVDWFRAATRGGRSPAEAWLAGWRMLWPVSGQGCIAGLDELAELLSRHGRLFPTLPEHAAWASRRTLSQQVRHLFRRRSGEPAAVFAYLALVALALEKLRGDLTRRTLFPIPEAAS